MSRKLSEGCPVPQATVDRITLIQGEGGRAMRRLISERVIAKFPPGSVQVDADAADVGTIPGNIAVSTDSYTVSPLFFPGGDIGSLAVYGTVNDLAMAGAEPLFSDPVIDCRRGACRCRRSTELSTASRAASSYVASRLLRAIPRSYPKGVADGLFINTTGVGLLNDPPLCGAKEIAVGDGLVVSRPIAEHGLAVMSAREQLEYIPATENRFRTLASCCQFVAASTR